MQLLALLLLLAVSAGALPQSDNLSPSETPTSTTTPMNSTAPYTHQKRGDNYPTLGNFDDDKCHGTHLGTKITIKDAACVQFAPTNKNIDIYWGDSVGRPQVYSDDHCGATQPLKTITGDNNHARTCASVASLGGTVLSVKFPNLFSFLGAGA